MVTAEPGVLANTQFLQGSTAWCLSEGLLLLATGEPHFICSS